MSKIDSERYALGLPHDELRQRIFAELGPIAAGMKLQRNRCLVATYFPPKITAGGIIKPVTVTEENRWQGKTGLLIKVGPTAFMYDEVVDFIGSYPTHDASAHFDLPQVGDWVAYTTSDTREIGVTVAPNVGASCRVIYDDNIVMRLNDPSIVW